MTISQVITDLPPAPQRSQPADFVVKADAHVASLTGFVNETNVAIGEINETQVEINTSEANAASSETNAAASEAAAISAANFKGIWSNLTGSISIPASLEHEGALYTLLNNLADVTASEPGVTADYLNTTGAKYVTPVAGAELSTIAINRLTTSDTFKYPIASTVQAGISITVSILEVDKGITPQIDLQGGDSADNGTDSVTDNVTYDARFTGLDDVVCNGVDTWEF